MGINWTKLRNKYNNKKVFVTGHTGFKGGWIVKILTMLGAEVKGYSLPPQTTPNLYSAIQVESICESVFGDIMDAAKLKEELVNFSPDFVFHLAAQPLVRLSYQCPAETFAVNSIGTAHLLDALRVLANPCIAILITTDKVYKNKEWAYPYRENEELGGYDPYSASKACAELLIDSYRNSFFNKNEYDKHKKQILVARAGNVIGGGDWSDDRLVPDIVRALQADEAVKLRNPNAVRPWQHVIEPLCGYLLLGALASEKEVSNAYNFGPLTEDTLTVAEMTQLAVNTLGKGGYEVEINENNPHEANLLKLDISLATSELKWVPSLRASDALRLTMEWYEAYYSHPEDIGLQTESQIKGYFSEVNQ